jgi:chaperonin GroEL
MQDIAVATGAQFVSEDIGLNLDDADLDILGTAEKLIITKDDTIIMGGAGERAEIDERVGNISSAIETTTSEYDREKL